MSALSVSCLSTEDVTKDLFVETAVGLHDSCTVPVEPLIELLPSSVLFGTMPI